MMQKGDNPKLWSDKKGQKYVHNGKGGKFSTHKNSPIIEKNKSLGKIPQKPKVQGE